MKHIIIALSLALLATGASAQMDPNIARIRKNAELRMAQIEAESQRKFCNSLQERNEAAFEARHKSKITFRQFIEQQFKNGEEPGAQSSRDLTTIFSMPVVPATDYENQLFVTVTKLRQDCLDSKQ